MANTIRLRRGSGAPSAGSFSEGEPAWDSTNGKLYVKDAAGAMVEIGGGAGSTYTFASTAPTSPSAGDTWTDADDGITYQYINDGDSSQWVELGPVGQKGNAGDPGAGVPEGGTTGQVLSKVSATDYDTAWASPAGSSTNLSYDAATRTLASDTGTDATLPLVTSSEAGLVPATGGGTTNFLRADGTFAAPPSGTDINGQTEVQSALDDELIIYDTSTSTNKKALVRDIGCQGFGGWGITPNIITNYLTANSNSANSFVVDRIYYIPILIPQTTTFNTYAVRFGSITGSSSNVFRLGLYTMNNGQPGDLILDAGSVACGGANNSAREIAINLTLGAGFYYTAYVTNDSALTVNRQSQFTIGSLCEFTGLDAINTGSNTTHLYEDLAGSAASGLPSTAASPISKSGGNHPVVFLYNV